MISSRTNRKASDMPIHVTPASANPVLDTLTQEFLDRFSGPAGSIEELRRRTSVADIPEGATVQAIDIDLDVPPDRIRGRLIIPPSASSPSPVLVFLCATKSKAGSRMRAEGLCHNLALASQIAVFCLETGEGLLAERVERALSALSAIYLSGHSLGIDGTKLAVAGDGIGAKLAAVVSMIMKDRPVPMISLQILFNPIFSDRFDTPSHQAFSEGPWLTSELISQAFDELRERGNEKLPSPKDASVRDLDGMPTTLVITAENDIARDDGEEFARKLMQAAVRVNAVRFLGTIHDFAILQPLAETPAAKGAIAQASASLKEAFNP